MHKLILGLIALAAMLGAVPAAAERYHGHRHMHYRHIHYRQMHYRQMHRHMRHHDMRRDHGHYRR